MKKLIMVMAAIAMLASFSFRACADDTATLTVTATFVPKLEIALNTGEWKIGKMGFDEKVINESRLSDDIWPPEALHRVTNKSIGYEVTIDMGYAAWEGPFNPEIEPGKGYFAMLLCEDGYNGGEAFRPTTDPEANLPLVEHLEEGDSKQIPLVLYSPSSGTVDPDDDNKEQVIQLALRAYSAIR